MGSIRKSPRSAGRPKSETRWEARYRDPAGRQRTKTFASQGAAKAWLATVEADVVRGSWVDPAGGRLLLSEWVEEWWPTVQNLRRSTRARDRGYLDRYIIPAFGRARLGAISQPDVKAWAAQLSAQGLAPATVTLAAVILGKVMDAAVDAGLIPVSPCRKLDLPKIERDEMRFLTPGEVGRLADSIDARYRSLVLVGCYGGLRIGELAGLRRRRVNLLTGIVDVAEIADETQGRLAYGPPKTRASRRTVSLPRPVVEELDQHLRRHDADLVFPAPDGGGLRVNSWRRRFWKPAVEKAKLTPLRPHDMRHTAVALWIAAGAGPLEVTRKAGHTSTSFTQDRYGHLFPEADERLTSALDGVFRGAASEPSPRGAVVELPGQTA